MRNYVLQDQVRVLAHGAPEQLWAGLVLPSLPRTQVCSWSAIQQIEGLGIRQFFGRLDKHPNIRSLGLLEYQSDKPLGFQAPGKYQITTVNTPVAKY